MSELINARSRDGDFRWQLLTSVSAMTLLTAVYGLGEAQAANSDADRPTVWIELGGQLEQMQNEEQSFAPPFVANLPDNFFSPLDVQKSLKSSFGGEGALTYQPDGSDWVFSAAVRFGRSNGTKQQHQQTPNAKVPVHFSTNGKYRGGYSLYPYNHVKFEDAKAQRSETHAVVDFLAGKDVGLGMFGRDASSILSIGVRIAQFTSKSSINLHAEPDVRYPSAPISSFQEKYTFKHLEHIKFHDYGALLTAQRSFRGIGPSIAWNGAAPFVGDQKSGEITLDWGANAALLFGRQKALGNHQTTSGTFSGTASFFQHATTAVVRGGYFNLGRYPLRSNHNAASFNRSRTVVVPNFGGMAGLSFRYSNAKVSFGYRADFFFGAIDGGSDAARKENVGFYGPFASISIGLGG